MEDAVAAFSEMENRIQPLPLMVRQGMVPDNTADAGDDAPRGYRQKRHSYRRHHRLTEHKTGIAAV